MPGNRLALAVVIACQKHSASFFRVSLQFFKQLCPPPDGNIFRLKIFFYVDGETGLWKIDQVPHGSFYHI